MSHIFVSYCQDDVDFANHLYSLLKAARFNVLMNDSPSADDVELRRNTFKNIKNASIMLVVMSEAGAGSHLLREEVAAAKKHGVVILPILFKGQAWSDFANKEYEDMQQGLSAKLSKTLVDKLQRRSPSEPLVLSRFTHFIQLHRQIGQDMFIRCLAVSPDGKHILIGMGGNNHNAAASLSLWTSTEARIADFRWFERSIGSIAFAPDAQTAIVSGDNTKVVYFDPYQAKIIHTFTHERVCQQVAIAPDGQTALSAGYGLKIWDLSNGTLIQHHEFSLAGADFCPNGQSVLVASGAMLRLLDLATGTTQFLNPDHVVDISAIGFSLNGEHALSAHTDNTVCIWNTKTGKLVRKLKKVGIVRVGFSPDGTKVFALTSEELLFYDFETGALIANTPKLGIGQRWDFVDAAFAPDGQTILTGAGQSGMESRVYRWVVPQD